MPDRGSSYEPFACAPGLKLEAHERLSTLRIETILARLDRIEAVMERLERRLWITVYGVVGVILAQAMQSLLSVTP